MIYISAYVASLWTFIYTLLQVLQAWQYLTTKYCRFLPENKQPNITTTSISDMIGSEFLFPLSSIAGIKRGNVHRSKPCVHFTIHNAMPVFFKLQFMITFTLILLCFISLVFVYRWTENMFVIEHIVRAIFGIMKNYYCTLNMIFHKIHVCPAWWLWHIVWFDVSYYS